MLRIPRCKPISCFRWHTRRGGRALAAGLAAIIVCGPADPTAAADWRDLLNFGADEDVQEEEPQPVQTGTQLDTRYVGTYVTAFGGTSDIEVQGVGLVNGLDETGGDPAPSMYRTALVDEMRRQNVKNPNQILAMPSTAMVLVKAHVPANCRKGDAIDVQVTLPPNGEATSLAGGVLFATRLTQQHVAGGRRHTGDVLAIAKGPILVSDIKGEAGGGTGLRRGKVLGGGAVKVDRHLAIALRNEFRSGRNSQRVANAIGSRFHGFDRSGIKIPMAEAKTDQLIELRVPEVYKHNGQRYLNVVRNIAVGESQISRRVRLKELEEQINTPAESELAGLRLEAIGPAAIPMLKRALLSDSIEVRFNAALALTYLEKTDGLEALAEAAKEEPAFRIYAFAAMACCEHSQASIALGRLLSNRVEETRYGAFRALTEINPMDPKVRAIPVEGGYNFHVLDVEGPTLVHVTNHTKSEVVLFGADQRLLLPATLRAGQHIQVIADSGSSAVTVSAYSGPKRGVKEVSPRLKDVILACDKLGASYPDIVDLLAQAERQHNLMGDLAVDALPRAGRTFTPEGDANESRKIGSEYTAPNLYAPPAEAENDAKQQDLADVPDEADSQADESAIQTVSAEMPAETTTDSDNPDAGQAPSQTREPAAGGRTGKTPASSRQGAEESNRNAASSETPTDETPTDETPIANTRPAETENRPWFDPRGWFDKDSGGDRGSDGDEPTPGRQSGGPPVQSEPE